MTDTNMKLHDTKWLAEILGVSVSVIEKRRSQKPISLPASFRIGRSIRYSEATVLAWLETCKVKY
jgi:predicted DNA-binding transcriptional regulator AlpA